MWPVALDRLGSVVSPTYCGSQDPYPGGGRFCRQNAWGQVIGRVEPGRIDQHQAVHGWLGCGTSRSSTTSTSSVVSGGGGLQLRSGDTLFPPTRLPACSRGNDCPSPKSSFVTMSSSGPCRFGRFHAEWMSLPRRFLRSVPRSVISSLCVPKCVLNAQHLANPNVDTDLQPVSNARDRLVMRSQSVPDRTVNQGDPRSLTDTHGRLVRETRTRR